MREWYSAAELAELKLPGMPLTESAVIRMAKREDWKAVLSKAGKPLARRRKGRGGGWEYSWQLLPARTQKRLVEMDLADKKEAGGRPPETGAGQDWKWFERLPDTKKEKARARLALVQAVEALERTGISKNDAVHHIAKTNGIGASTVYSWFEKIAGLPAADRLPALAPRHAGRTVTTAECDPAAWDFLRADYLRLEKPSFTSCVRRLQAVAAEQGWTVPNGRTLERRIEREIPKPVIVLARQGAEKLKQMYPPQRRDRTEFHALQAVNADGHKWDVFARWPDGTIGRPVMVAIQDLYSNKILGWRVDKTENADSVRLAFLDVFRTYGVPEFAWLDNGRNFASKWITGGQPNRYRFKVKPEEPSGVLTNLGVEVCWTKPYSGQSKPIERAFRDFCDAIAKHPAFAGAYTGNKPEAKPENYGSRAVPIEDFIRIAGEGIREHNARPGRRTRICAGRMSFDQAFEESYARSLIRKAGEEQLQRLMLAAEAVRADRRSGEINLLGNRYWADCMHELAGHPVTVRFDPDNLHAGVHVYRLDGSHAGFAACLEDTGFADTSAAREHARNRTQFMKATKAAAEAERRMSLQDLVALLPEVEEEEPAEAKTVRPLFAGNAALKTEELPEEADREDADVLLFEQLGKALDLKQAQQD